MGEIPKQWASKLNLTEIPYSASANQVFPGASIKLNDGTKLIARIIIIACDPQELFS